ncbi:AMP-binding protein, partial [Actinoalloteichus spitiensis]|uniref:AMP-binding protein n=1 Tax=Actinoalloteichus spitiensis TaxID=252394 RepID=UPI00146F89E4
MTTSTGGNERADQGGDQPEPGRSSVRPSDCLHHLLERRAAMSPLSTAVTSEADSISYSELNSRANQVARAVLARGIRPGDRVGLCLDRSVDLVVALVGVLKTGASYVPMDPRYPADRLRYTMDDAGIRLAIGTSETVPSLPSAVSVLRIDEETAAIASFPDGDLSDEERGGRVSPDSVAYVIYTSGSTGRPK